VADDFAAALASRLTAHPAFWDDVEQVHIAGIHASITGMLAEPNMQVDSLQVGRLLYTASILSQTTSETNRSLAQTIVLSALLAKPDSRLRERTKAILANLGNFPAVSYISGRYPSESLGLLSDLRVALLRANNSVSIGEKDIALTDFQLDIWEDLPHQPSMSISAPTSAGKSFLIIEYLCQRALRPEPFIGIFIAPTRALLAEVYRKINARVGLDTGVRVSTVPSLDAENRQRQIFVLTQERLYVLLSTAALRADLVVVDEAQNLADGARGMILQDCLERLRAGNADVQTIFLSPGAEGFSELSNQLGVPSIETKETDLSPVLQNRILVRAKDGEPKQLVISLLTAKGSTEIATIATRRGMADPGTRLAAAALELAADGSALVYATGPVDAEKVASQLAADLPVQSSTALEGLAKFIRDHIHPEYGLASMVRHGVGFHYGRMPTLLREALETSFREGDIKYLACTTTLFQGVNLPARSVFINTPTRGRGVKLDAAHLWNFAGRAGRLGQDLVGNVFLVDYHKWKDQELDKRARYRIAPALSTTVENNFDMVLDAVRGQMPKSNPRSSTPSDVRAAAGLILARTATNRSSVLLDRLTNLSATQKTQLHSAAAEGLTGLQLPGTLLENNWTVDPYGLQRLAQRMVAKIAKGELEELVPVHPRDPHAYERYAGIFNRIAREVLGYKAGAYGGFLATYALPWMDGVPYPALLSKWVVGHRKRKPNADINSLVRKAFDFIEDVLRFQMVQLGKAYVDVLYYILDNADKADERRRVFDYSLALELGVSTKSGRAFIELGTSRITALALEALFPDSELTPQAARSRLKSLDVKAVGLSDVIIAELRQLKLLSDQT
jgi:hypothetical protein